MVETQTVVACRVCASFWSDGQQPLCTEAGHTHSRHEMHRHRDAVALPDGSTVIAVSFDVADPYGRDRVPDYGLYLDHRWQPPWEHDHVDWPDFGLPADPAAFVRSLRAVLERVDAGERVELGCLGAHGRTGTALACLAVLRGHPPADAVAWVRAVYCAGAVETPQQEQFVTSLPVDAT